MQTLLNIEQENASYLPLQRGVAKKHIKPKDLTIKAISKALKRRLEATSHLINLEEDPELLANQKYSSMCKVVNLDIKQEYKNHLKMMDNLKMFKQTRTVWDHAFYKSFVLTIPEVAENYKTIMGQ